MSDEDFELMPGSITSPCETVPNGGAASRAPTHLEWVRWLRSLRVSGQPQAPRGPIEVLFKNSG